MLRAGCDFRVEMTTGTRERLDVLVGKHLTGRNHRNRWETRSVNAREMSGFGLCPGPARHDHVE